MKNRDFLTVKASLTAKYQTLTEMLEEIPRTERKRTMNDGRVIDDPRVADIKEMLQAVARMKREYRSCCMPKRRGRRAR